MTPTQPPPNRARRRYNRHGRGLVAKALPYLIERVADPTIPADALTPIERAAREWRQEALKDLGGAEAVAAAKLALLDTAVGSLVILHSLDRYLFELAVNGGLVNRKHRRAFSIVADRMRVADSLARQLQALGLERQARQAPSLQDYLAQVADGSLDRRVETEAGSRPTGNLTARADRGTERRPARPGGAVAP